MAGDQCPHRAGALRQRDRRHPWFADGDAIHRLVEWLALRLRPRLVCGRGGETGSQLYGRGDRAERTGGWPRPPKPMPVIGVFAPTDQPGDLPTVAVQATAFQGWTTGTTSLHAATGTMTGVRIGIADERGDGRPDFAYQARMFYADSITPAIVGTAGATVTITGVGFRNGNAVAINECAGYRDELVGECNRGEGAGDVSRQGNRPTQASMCRFPTGPPARSR